MSLIILFIGTKSANISKIYHSIDYSDTSLPNSVSGSPSLSAASPVNENIAPSRRGKKNISGYFAPEVHRQLRVIAAEEDKNLQEILGDALNTFFERKGKPPIA